MAYLYTADELISDVQARGMLAPSSNTLATADYLRFINDEIQSYMVPFVMSTREEFFVTSSDVSVTSGTAAYAIPSRAIGAKLRNVLLLNGSEYEPLPRLEPEAVLREGSFSGTPEGFYLEGNSVVLYPTPSSATTLRLSFFIRPNRVVSVSEAGLITGTPSATVTISSAPSAFPTASTSYDLVKGTPHFECRAIDKAATRVTTTLTFSTATTGLVAGDYVCLAGETPIPQIPVELHPLLAERVAARALHALGDQRAQLFEASAERMKKGLEALLTPRSEGSSRRIINYSAPGWSSRRRLRGQ